MIEVYKKTIEIGFNELISKMNNDKKFNKNSDSKSYLLTYHSKDEFLKFADHFQMMNDFKVNSQNIKKLIDRFDLI
jgi:hypothetical protein